MMELYGGKGVILRNHYSRPSEWTTVRFTMGAASLNKPVEGGVLWRFRFVCR